MAHRNRDSRTYRALIRLAVAIEDVAREQRCEEHADDVLSDMFADVMAYRQSYLEDPGRNRNLLLAVRPLFQKLGKGAAAATDVKMLDQIESELGETSDKLKSLLK